MTQKYLQRYNKEAKMNYEIIPAPDGRKNVLYRTMRVCCKMMNIRKMLIGSKEEVLERVAKINARNPFILPTDKKAYYTDHLIQNEYHCLEIDMEDKRKERAILFVFGGGMILGSDKGDIGLSRRIAKETGCDIWFPYYPLCHEHDILENVQMVFECYTKMLKFYRPKNIVFLGFSSGGALILDLITYINAQRDLGKDIPMPGFMVPVSAASIPVTQDEKDRLHELDSKDIFIPESYAYLAREILLHGHDVDEKYVATAHGDFRNAPETHFYYGSAETMYAFAPSYAESYRKSNAKCRIHVSEGMHHCYALQYSVPGCKSAFKEIMKLIKDHFGG
ncbi:MAG: alpha/beta hydrolase [Lachnospiraceae bacterium]|nr:alpha/beta hydrolase [Lachnospiraceae bacterium]